MRSDRAERRTRTGETVVAQGVETLEGTRYDVAADGQHIGRIRATSAEDAAEKASANASRLNAEDWAIWTSYHS